MTILEAKQALIKRATVLKHTDPTGRDLVKQRKENRKKQRQEMDENALLCEPSDRNPELDALFNETVADIDKKYEETIDKRSKSSNLNQAVHALNSKGSCSLNFFRHIRQASFENNRCPEEQQHFNEAFDAFDALHPERASWTPAPNLMRTIGAVLVCSLALSSGLFGLSLVAAVLLYFNDSNAPYFEPNIIDEAFPEAELELMLSPG